MLGYYVLLEIHEDNQMSYFLDNGSPRQRQLPVNGVPQQNGGEDGM